MNQSVTNQPAHMANITNTLNRPSVIFLLFSNGFLPWYCTMDVLVDVLCCGCECDVHYG